MTLCKHEKSAFLPKYYSKKLRFIAAALDLLGSKHVVNAYVCQFSYSS